MTGAVSPLVLTVPAALAMALLWLAAWRRFGGRFTLMATAAVLAFFFIKEFMNVRGLLLGHHYKVNHAFFQLLDVSPTVVLGHCFTLFAGLLAGDRVVARAGLAPRASYYMVSVAAAATATAWIMETIGIAGGWWAWQKTGAPFETSYAAIDHVFIVAPPAAIAGWPLYMGIFLAMFAGCLWIAGDRAGGRLAWIAVPLPFVALFPLWRDEPMSVPVHACTTLALLALCAWSLGAALGRRRAWLGIFPVALLEALNWSEMRGGVVMPVAVIAAYAAAALLPAFEIAPQFRPRAFQAPWLDAVARRGLEASLAIFFAVIVYVLARAGGDPRMWANVLPAAGAALLALAPVPALPCAAACAIAAGALFALRVPYLGVAILFVALLVAAWGATVRLGAIGARLKEAKNAS